VVWDLAYDWHDADWMAGRKATVALDAPMTTYEVHLGSWRRAFEEPGRLFSYEEIAPQLIEHVLAMASPTSNSCPSWSTPSTVRGATR